MRTRWAAFFLAYVACTGSSSNPQDAGGPGPSCSAFGGSDLVDGATMCTMKFAGCTDGLTYTVTCPGALAPCSCEVEGGAAGQFAENACGLAYASQLSAVNQGCGWSLR
jgi:hypothetical protein